VELSIRLQLQH